jgi:hypothetical protein
MANDDLVAAWKQIRLLHEWASVITQNRPYMVT